VETVPANCTLSANAEKQLFDDRHMGGVVKVGGGLVLYRYFFPEVGIASLEPLEHLDVEIEYRFEQTCCGQPVANSGIPE
jgi:Fe-S oxidoreductase